MSNGSSQLYKELREQALAAFQATPFNSVLNIRDERWRRLVSMTREVVTRENLPYVKLRYVQDGGRLLAACPAHVLTNPLTGMHPGDAHRTAILVDAPCLDLFDFSHDDGENEPSSIPPCVRSPEGACPHPVEMFVLEDDNTEPTPAKALAELLTRARPK